MIDDVGQHSHLSHFSASFVDYQSLVIQSLVIFGKISVRPLNSVPPCGAESSFGSVGFACGYPHAVFAVRTCSRKLDFSGVSTVFGELNRNDPIALIVRFNADDFSRNVNVFADHEIIFTVTVVEIELC